MYVARITEWNAKRYEQEHSSDLTIRILAEELGELARAKEEVDQLDALVDLVYISIGAMWKMGLDNFQIYEAIKAVCDSNDSKEVKRVGHNVKANIVKGPGYFKPEPRLQEILDDRFPF